MRRLCIGLTGGIGSGKSTVAELFRELGASIIDTDAISHELTRPNGKAIPDILSAFGAGFIDASGALDRSKMRGTIIADASARQRLERILHPMILAACQERLREPAPYHRLVAPLLLESPDFLKLADRVLLIDSTEENQVSRVMQRSPLSESEVRAIMVLQLPREERARRADDIIGNDGTLEELKPRVAALHRRYANLATTI